ncbi:MAG: MOSC N-terminal beta barrel domain-containing protein [Chloroherpetonaceae bacterium]|nr:MOSC N-terminal beta barrel domain-containing protein [Chloroherpetonaceae bacterium]
MFVPEVTHIFIYPFKSLDGIAVQDAVLLENGALQHDRRFALIDDDGNYINGKRNPRVHLIRASFNLENEIISLSAAGFSPESFEFNDPQLLTYFCDFFEQNVSIQENKIAGFPDDTSAPGFTLASTPSLVKMKTWFPELSLENLRRRFRHNIEISAPYSFWEDSLLGESELESRFHIGENAFLATGACSRCVVPTRDPETAELYPRFQKEFSLQREMDIHAETALSHFKHFYKFSINTKSLMLKSNRIQLGESVTKS